MTRHITRCVALACALACALSGGAGAQRAAIRGTATVANAPATEVVVYLVPAASPTVPVAEPLTAEMDQRQLRFVPLVIAVSPGSTVNFSNSDAVMHNVFHPVQRNGGFDLGLFAPGEHRSFTFREEGSYVIFCHVHPEMVGHVVVVASPWRAVTDENGRFTLEGVPAGSYRLRTWNRRLETLSQLVTVPAEGTAHVELSLIHGVPTEPRATDRP